jgi:hypothetical protein
MAAPVLPQLPDGDVCVLVAGGVGMLMVAATALSLLPARETTVGPVLILLGTGLLVGALTTARVGAGANVVEAMLAATLGLLFARMLATPIVAIAVPLFVAAIDILSVGFGPSSKLLEQPGDRVDALSFDLPTWGDGGSVGRLGLADAVFLALFASWALRYGFRRVPTIAAMSLALIASLVLGIAMDRAIPVLPLMAAGYLLPNLDRIRDVLEQRQ